MKDKVNRVKILAVASRGGHWIQLLRLRPAFSGIDIVYVTTDPEYKSMVEGASFRSVFEATRKSKLRLILLCAQLLWIIIRERPTSIVSTGAAPGYLAIRIGKFLGIRTLWVDSIANAEELSLSGKMAMKYADVVLTQWSHLQVPGSVEYQGSVI